MKKIVQLILALVIVGLVYVIYDQISTPIRFENVKKAKEEAVIERIKDIRTAERAFKSKYQHFTGDFDTLINFVLNDSIEGQRRIVDEDDSVAMAQLKKAGKKNIETFTVAVPGISTYVLPTCSTRQTMIFSTFPRLPSIRLVMMPNSRSQPAWLRPSRRSSFRSSRSRPPT